MMILNLILYIYILVRYDQKMAKYKYAGHGVAERNEI